MSAENAIREVGLKDAKRAIEKAIKIRRPVMLWGAPGLGKSEVIEQIAKSQNRPVIDVRLALWDPTDIKGIPYYDANSSSMVWAPPAELPSDPDSNAILFLDELPNAAPSVQGSAFQLILNRRVGQYVLPDGVDIVAAGNRQSDRGCAYKMPTPLANRFIHLNIKPVFDDWLEWATENFVHPDVVGYVSFAKQDLHNFDPKSQSMSFPTPRSWFFVSELIKDEDLGVDSPTLATLVSGAIGDGVALKFLAHRKIASKLPKPSEIIKGKVKTLETDEVSAMYSLVVSLCYELKELHDNKAKNFHVACDNFLNYLMANMPTEIVVMAVKIALTTYKINLDPHKMKSFTDFHNRYGKFILQSMS